MKSKIINNDILKYNTLAFLVTMKTEEGTVLIYQAALQLQEALV